MHRRAITLLPLVLLGTRALARDAAVTAPIATFSDSFNKGDVPGAAATMTDAVAITDEFAPFHWEGTGAFATWGANYEADAKTKGITDPSVKIGASTREVVTGNHAYVVVPATYRFKQKGVRMVEIGQMTSGLVRGASGWKIDSWTWTGPDPKVAK